MIDKILGALKSAGIQTWVINSTESESCELFYIRKKEDMRRATKIGEISVTVYRDFELDGKKMRGSSAVMVYPGTDDAQLKSALVQAYENAQYVKNPFYELPAPVKQTIPGEKREPLTQTAEKMAKALLDQDTGKESFINSAELFVSAAKIRTLTSEGTDVSYETPRITGEFVVQCKQPQDVEMYFSFDYSKPDTEALSALAVKALEQVRDRANACDTPLSGTYDVLLTDDAVGDLMGILLSKTNAALVYPGYSHFKQGSDLNGENVQGERLSIDVFAREPFSRDGIPMPRRALIKDGVVQGIFGETRFCRYLGIEPTGSYRCLELKNGTKPLEDLKKGRVLMPVAFSDFDCDDFRSSFAGEMRLAYLFEDGKVTLLKGGSINGSLLRAMDSLVFSLERYETSSYSGPKAVRIPGVSVAGK